MNPQSPIQRYLHDIKHNGFEQDSAQLLAVTALNQLYIELQKYLEFRPEPLTMMQKLLGKKVSTAQSPKGLYMWGGVGRGKTYLMDTFYHALPVAGKMRVHFHRFMYQIHDELKGLNDISDPLDIVAERLAEQVQIICFDEFYVSDITDAMILSTLFNALFSRGVILVATSNIPPTDLYRNGLQRSRFLPTIALIEKYCDVLNVDSGIDFRLRTLKQAEIYHSPLDDSAAENIKRYFSDLTPQCESKEVRGEIEVNHRLINVEGSCEGVLFASFSQLCESPRSQNDYIELSRYYHTVLLSNVRQMGPLNGDAARRFIALVDEFYERNVTLIISAEVEIEDLYSEGQLTFEFERCKSRLIEMQSHEYLAREHLG
ncbi:cell division protein ZapE [Vibrio sp. FNV 38]|nr:cell division protein ZapE [Vibrio sp. FNV 38]